MALATGLLAISSAHALIIGMSGSAAAPLFTPTDLSSGSLQQNGRVFGIDERQQVSIVAATLVDVVVDASLFGVQQRGLGTQRDPQQLSAGNYASHLLHFDPVNAGTVENAVFLFDAPIVALIFSTRGSGDLMAASDSLFGLSGVNYQTAYQRRMENQERFTVVDANTLSIDYARANASWYDQLRVVTQSQTGGGNQQGTVTSPSTLLLISILCLPLLARSRNSKQ